MTLERNLSPVERELRFRLWCEREGVERILFDLDDTLCSTRKVFREKMEVVYDFLSANAPVLTRNKWREEIEESNNRAFEKFGVNPNRWDHVLDELSDRHQIDEEVVEEAKQIFQSIYTTPLKMLNGAEEVLQFVKKVGVPMGVVTHAGTKWTWEKYNWLNLGRFLEWDEVYEIDENQHKTAESWMEAVRYFRLKPEECLVAGDSPRSDINPAREIGVKHCFLIEKPNQWSVHNEPVDASVIKISKLTQLVDIVVGSY